MEAVRKFNRKKGRRYGDPFSCRARSTSGFAALSATALHLLPARVKASLAILRGSIPFGALIGRQDRANLVLLLLPYRADTLHELFALRLDARPRGRGRVTLLTRVTKRLELRLTLLAQGLELRLILLVNRLDARLLRIGQVEIRHEASLSPSKLSPLSALATLTAIHLAPAPLTAFRGVGLYGSLRTSLNGETNDSYGAESSRAKFRHRTSTIVICVRRTMRSDIM
jgi:hypothetical protein